VKTSAGGFGLQVAVRDPLQDPWRRRDLERGRLQDRGPALSGPERDGGASLADAEGSGGHGQALAAGEPGG
jgi:hypothetical protein